MMAATGGAGNALAAHEFVDTREQVIVAVEEQVFEHPVAVAIPTYLAAVAPRHLQQEIAKLTTSATEFLWMHRTNGTDKIQGSRRKFATRLFLMLTAKLHSLFGSVTEYQVFCLHARRLAVQLAKHKSKASKLVAEDAEMGSD